MHVMYFVVVYCLIATTVALPVLPDPPSLPNRYQETDPNANVLKNSSSSLEIKKDEDKVKENKVKVVLATIPPPPELPPFDYSTLQKPKNKPIPKYDFDKPAAEEPKKSKNIVSEEELIHNKDNDTKKNIKLAEESKPIKDKEGENEIKENKKKFVLATISPPPELPPFHYSTLPQQILKQTSASHVSNKTVIAEPEKKKKDVTSEKELVSSEEETKLAKEPKLIENKKNEIELKEDKLKVALAVIPPSPEQPTLNYSSLQKQKSKQTPKSAEAAKLATEEPEDSKIILPIDNKNNNLNGERKPTVETTPLEEAKPVAIYKEEPKPSEEAKPIEVLQEEKKPLEQTKPVEISKVEFKEENHSHDIPVPLSWYIPTQHFLSGLFPKFPFISNIGLSWPFRRVPSMFKRPRLICTNFNSDVDGPIYMIIKMCI